MGVATAEASLMFTLNSPAYKDQSAMDARFTCEGAEVSPPLSWNGAPAGTKSYALIIDDPDAPDPARPERTWVHWVLYDIPASVSTLAEGASQTPPGGSRDGTNDFGKSGYGGPCPPVGRHRYFHKLYALDVVLPDLHNPSKAQLLAAMKGHVVAETQLIGTYQKH
jgi:Raf kinase inhibitor-like YbhB/YbcL family protein